MVAQRGRVCCGVVVALVHSGQAGKGTQRTHVASLKALDCTTLLASPQSAVAEIKAKAARSTRLFPLA